MINPQSGRRLLRINNYDLAYEEQGSGFPTILIHGALGDYRSLEPQSAEFSKHFRTIRISLRHCWPEEWNGEGNGYSVSQHVDDVAAFIAAVTPGKVYIVGHSRGGHVALRIAEKYPQLVRRLVLAEPAGGFDDTLAPPSSDSGSIATSMRSAMAQAVEYVKRGEIDNGLRHFLNFTGGPGSWEKRSPERQQLARDNAFTLLGDANHPLPLFSKETLQRIRIPTLLLHGENTEPVFKKILDVMELNIPNVKRATIPNAAHVMNRDNPEDFNAKVMEFLKTPN